MKFEPLAPPPLHFGPILFFALELFRRLGWQVAIIAALLLPLELAQIALRTAIQMKVVGWGFGPTALLGIVTSSLSSIAFLSLGLAGRKGEGLKFLSLCRDLALWPQVFCTQLLCGLLILCGFLLLIVPGIYGLLRLVVTDLVVVIDRVSAPTAIKRSLSLTKGREGRLLVVLGTWVSISVGIVVLLYFLYAALPVLESLPLLITAIYLSLLMGALYHFVVIGIYLALVRGSNANSVELEERVVGL